MYSEYVILGVAAECSSVSGVVGAGPRGWFTLHACGAVFGPVVNSVECIIECISECIIECIIQYYIRFYLTLSTTLSLAPALRTRRRLVSLSGRYLHGDELSPLDSRRLQ